MNTPSTQSFPISGWITTDSPSTTWQVREVPQDPEELHAQALVASGEYFESLAAILEQVAGALPLHSMEQYQLQHVVSQLLYLQKHYDITKK